MQEILIIEDDLDFSRALKNMLARQGYTVFVTQSGLDGLRHFREHPSDLVITDIILPDRDGLNVILSLKKFLPDVKIIAISGGGHCASGEEYLKDVQLLSKVQYTLAKPFHKDELFSMIHEALDH